MKVNRDIKTRVTYKGNLVLSTGLIVSSVSPSLERAIKGLEKGLDIPDSYPVLICLFVKKRFEGAWGEIHIKKCERGSRKRRRQNKYM